VLPGFALGHFSPALIEFRETCPRVERGERRGFPLRGMLCGASGCLDPPGRPMLFDGTLKRMLSKESLRNDN
jgi:hypothetical protein